MARRRFFDSFAKRYETTAGTPKKAKERQEVKRNKNDIFCKSHQ
jgi:hypothetical protein